MKKFLLMIVAVLMMTFSSNAQQTTVEGSKFFNNTYVGVSVGGQVGLNDIIGHNNWTIAPTGSLYLGKWVTPILGLELNGDVLFHDGFNSRHTFVDATYVGLNGRVNLNNVFHRYRGVPDRVEVIPFVGFGWLHGYGHGVYTTHNLPTVYGVGRNAFATKMGIDLAINLGKERAWVIDVRPTVEYALTGGHVKSGVKYDVRNGRLGLEVGFTYKFGHKNSVGTKTHNFTKAYTVKEYNDMVAELSNRQPERIVEVQEVVREVVREVEVPVQMPVYLLTQPYFSRNSTIIDPTADVVLDYLIKEINSNDANYVITGYASLEGVEQYNVELSKRRAQAVYDILVGEGINPERLTVVAGGPTDQFGDAYETNRTVTVQRVNQ